MNKKSARTGPKIRITRSANLNTNTNETAVSPPKVVDESNYIYTCEYCRLKFTNNSHYLRHMTSTHEVQQHQATFECNECQIVFSKKINLDRHCQTHHQAKIKSKCETCPLTFKSRYCLKRHLRMKQLMIENSCLRCHKMFLSRDQLFKHVQNKHTFKNRTFQCDLCSLKFKAKESLVSHLNRIHKSL